MNHLLKTGEWVDIKKDRMEEYYNTDLYEELVAICDNENLNGELIGVSL